MNSTTTLAGIPDFDKQLVNELFSAIDRGTKQAYQMVWSFLRQFLFEHWLSVIVMLIAVLLLAVTNYLATGRWGMLAGLLYNYLYFGILFTITLISGSDIFANDYFKIVLVIIYVVCFSLVGIFLKKTGIRR